MSDIKCRIYPLWHTLAECCPGHAGHGMQTGAFFSRSVRLIRIPDQRGLVGSTVTLDYLAFRLPQHFDLMSITAAVWVALNLVLQAAVYWWLRRTGRPESRDDWRPAADQPYAGDSGCGAPDRLSLVEEHNFPSVPVSPPEPVHYGVRRALPVGCSSSLGRVGSRA